MDAANPQPRCTYGLSRAGSPEPAAAELTEQLRLDGPSAPPQAVVLFANPALVPDPSAAQSLIRALRDRLDPATLVGAVCRGVIAGGEEIEEDGPAASAMALWGSGFEARAFSARDLPVLDGSPIDPASLIEPMSLGREHRGMLLLADPLSAAVRPLTEALSALGALDAPHGQRGPVVGAFASGAGMHENPGANLLFVNDRVIGGRVARPSSASGGTPEGLVGLSLVGQIALDAVVSQGCRPVGPPMVVTEGEGSRVRTLNGHPALGVLREAVGALEEPERELLSGGLFLGRLIDEFKERPGRGDYLVRNVVGHDADTGALTIGGQARTGSTVRLHLRDARTARDDLALLLDGQQFDGSPAGVLLMSCASRGESFFGSASADAQAVQRSFRTPLDGAQLAKPGSVIGDDPAVSVPLAGCFGAGEIGSIGSGVHVHGHTAVLGLVRATRAGLHG